MTTISIAIGGESRLTLAINIFINENSDKLKTYLPLSLLIVYIHTY